MDIIIKVPYLKTDTNYELIFKNMKNIVDLYEKLDYLITNSDTRFEDLAKAIAEGDQLVLDEVNKLAQLVGTYATDDPNGELDDSLSVLRNLVIVKENLTSALNQIKALDNRVQQLETNGLGDYLGTFKGTDENDVSPLPTPVNDKERAHLEFLVGDDVKYQEYKWLNNQWNKIGNILDSHIHSQSGGISLQDVSNQQDPKIALKVSIDDLILKPYTINNYVFSKNDIGKTMAISWDETLSSVTSVTRTLTGNISSFILNNTESSRNFVLEGDVNGYRYSWVSSDRANIKRDDNTTYLLNDFRISKLKIYE